MGVAVILVCWKVFPSTRALHRSAMLHVSRDSLCLAFLSTKAMQVAGKEMPASVVLTCDMLHHYNCMAKIFHVADVLGSPQCLGENRSSIWKATNNLPLKIVCCKCFMLGSLTALSCTVHVPWRSQHEAGMEFPLEANIIADCTEELVGEFGCLMELGQKRLRKGRR